MDTITKQLADALRDLQYATLMRPSCQAGHALRCLCSGCAEVRANKALAAYDAQPHHMPEARKMVQQARQPLSEAQVVKCLVDSGCIGTVKMSFDSGPYEITRPSFNANRLVGAVEIAHGITGEQP